LLLILQKPFKVKNFSPRSSGTSKEQQFYSNSRKAVRRELVDDFIIQITLFRYYKSLNNIKRLCQ